MIVAFGLIIQLFLHIFQPVLIRQMTLQIDYKSSLLGPTLTPVGIWRPLVAAGTIRTGEERKRPEQEFRCGFTQKTARCVFYLNKPISEWWSPEPDDLQTPSAHSVFTDLNGPPPVGTNTQPPGPDSTRVSSRSSGRLHVNVLIDLFITVRLFLTCFMLMTAAHTLRH